MSIVVLGANAPQNKECGCFDCEIRRSCKLLKRGAYQLKGIKEEYRKKYCPIRELPKCHGRLIDADKLVWFIDNHIASGKKWVEFETIKDMINLLPTIIEAEGK